MKRTWREASVVPLTPGYALALDGKPKLTPAGHNYACPTAALAAALAAEWQNAPQDFDPRAMPVTQIIATLHDRTATHRTAIIDEVAAYAASDLLCLRAGHPAPLVALQRQHWQPFLDWALERYDALLVSGEGLQAPVQAPAARQALRGAVTVLDDLQLTILQQAVSITGSLVLGLALLTSWRDADAIYEAAELESRFQLQQWGADAEAQQRQEAIRAELTTLAQIVALGRTVSGN